MIEDSTLLHNFIFLSITMAYVNHHTLYWYHGKKFHWMVAISMIEDSTLLHNFIFLSIPMAYVNHWKLLSLNKGCNKKLLPSALFWTNWLYKYRGLHIETCIAEGSVISDGDVKGRICEADFCPHSIVRCISVLHLVSWFWSIRPQDLWSHGNDIL